MEGKKIKGKKRSAAESPRVKPVPHCQEIKRVREIKRGKRGRDCKEKTDRDLGIGSKLC